MLEVDYNYDRLGAVDIQDGAAALIEGVTDLLLIYRHTQLPVLLDPDRLRCTVNSGHFRLKQPVQYC